MLGRAGPGQGRETIRSRNTPHSKTDCWPGLDSFWLRAPKRNTQKRGRPSSFWLKRDQDPSGRTIIQNGSPSRNSENVARIGRFSQWFLFLDGRFGQNDGKDAFVFFPPSQGEECLSTSHPRHCQVFFPRDGKWKSRNLRVPIVERA